MIKTYKNKYNDIYISQDKLLEVSEKNPENISGFFLFLDFRNNRITFRTVGLNLEDASEINFYSMIAKDLFDYSERNETYKIYKLLKDYTSTNRENVVYYFASLILNELKQNESFMEIINRFKK